VQQWIAVLGTALGAVIGIGSALVSDRVRWKREQHRDRLGVRRELYASYIAALTETHESMRAASGRDGLTAAQRAGAVRDVFYDGALYQLRYQIGVLVVGMVRGAGRRVQLVQRVDDEPGPAQDRDPPAVAEVELDPAGRRRDAVQVPLRPLQAVPGRPGTGRPAQRVQRAHRVKDQPPAGAQQPGRLGNPSGRVRPQARPAFGDHQVEPARGQRDVRRVGLDQREHDPGLLLAPESRAQLRPGHVQADRAGAAPGQPGREVRGPAAQLDHVQAADVPEHAQVALGHVEDAPRDLIGQPGPVRAVVRVRRVDPGPRLPVGGDGGVIARRPGVTRRRAVLAGRRHRRALTPPGRR
jgi:hypothetical protein